MPVHQIPFVFWATTVAPVLWQPTHGVQDQSNFLFWPGSATNMTESKTYTQLVWPIPKHMPWLWRWPSIYEKFQNVHSSLATSSLSSSFDVHCHTLMTLMPMQQWSKRLHFPCPVPIASVIFLIFMDGTILTTMVSTPPFLACFNVFNTRPVLCWNM